MYRARRITITSLAAVGVVGAASLAVFSSFATDTASVAPWVTSASAPTNATANGELDQLYRQATELRTEAAATQAKIDQALTAQGVASDPSAPSAARPTGTIAIRRATRPGASKPVKRPSLHANTGASGASSGKGQSGRKPTTIGGNNSSSSSRPATQGSTGASGSGGGSGTNRPVSKPVAKPSKAPVAQSTTGASGGGTASGGTTSGGSTSAGSTGGGHDSGENESESDDKDD